MVLTNSLYTSRGRLSLANNKHCLVSSMYTFFRLLHRTLSSAASLGDAIFLHPPANQSSTLICEHLHGTHMRMYRLMAWSETTKIYNTTFPFLRVFWRRTHL
jgi:hypothetical protein